MARRARVASRTGVSRGARVTARVVRRRARRSTRAVLDCRARRACACGVVLPGRARAHRDPSLDRASGTTGVARAGVRHAAVNPYDPALGTLRAAIARIARGALRANRIVARRARDLRTQFGTAAHSPQPAPSTQVPAGSARACIGDPARGHVALLAASTGATDLASPTDGVIRRGAGHTFGAPDHSGARDTRVAHAIGPIAAHALIAVGHPSPRRRRCTCRPPNQRHTRSAAVSALHSQCAGQAPGMAGSASARSASRTQSPSLSPEPSRASMTPSPSLSRPVGALRRSISSASSMPSPSESARVGSVLARPRCH